MAKRGGIGAGFREQAKQGKFNKSGGQNIEKVYKKAEKQRKENKSPVRTISSQVTIPKSHYYQDKYTNLPDVLKIPEKKREGFRFSLNNKRKAKYNVEDVRNTLRQVGKGEFNFSIKDKKEKQKQEQKVSYDMFDHFIGEHEGGDLIQFANRIEKSKMFVHKIDKEILDGKRDPLSLEEKVANVNAGFSGNYSYGVDPKTVSDWAVDNIYEVEVDGKKEYRLKANATLPPMRYDYWGNSVDIEQIKEDQKFLVEYELGNKYLTKEKEEKEKREKKQKEMTANYNDENIDTTNSILDVVSDAASGRKGLLDGLFDYHKKYFYEPWKEGEMKIVGVNALVNLAETMDYAAKGSKAFLYGTKGIYGADEFITARQNNAVWLYGEGTGLSEKQRQSNQKKLIELGALDLVRGSARISSSLSKIEIEEAIKKAGLWEAYKQFALDYQEYKKHDEGSSFSLKAVKDVYSNKQHVDFHTGDIKKDLLGELISDPTIVFSAFAGATRAGARSGIKGLTKEVVQDAVNKSDVGNKIIERYTKEYTKRFSDRLMSKNYKDIAKDVNGFAATLRRVGAFSSDSEMHAFKNNLLKSINNKTDDLSFKMLRAINFLDLSVVNRLDRMALKSVFGVPYLTYKGIKIPYKIIKRTSWNARHIDRKAVGRVRRASKNELTNRLDLTCYNAAHEAMAGEALAEDLNFVNKIDNEMVSSGEQWMQDIGQIYTDSLKNLSDNPHVLYDYLDNYITTVTGGKIKYYTEFIEYVDNLPFGNKSLDALRDALHIQKKNIDEAYTIAYDRYKYNLTLDIAQRYYHEGLLSDAEYAQIVGKTQDELKYKDPFHQSNTTGEVRNTNFNEGGINTVLQQSDKNISTTLPVRGKKEAGDYIEKEHTVVAVEKFFDLYNKRVFDVNGFKKLNNYLNRTVFKVDWKADIKGSGFIVDLIREHKKKIIDLDDFKAMWKESGMEGSDKFIVKSYNEYLKKVNKVKVYKDYGSVKNIRVTEMYEWLSEGIDALRRKQIMMQALEEDLSIYEQAVLSRAEKLFIALENDYKEIIKKEAQADFVEVHEDIGHAFFRFMEKGAFGNYFKKLTTASNLFGKYLVNLKTADVNVLSNELERILLDSNILSGSEEYAKYEKALMEKIEFLQDVTQLMSYSERYVEFNNFINSIVNNTVGLSQEKKIAIVEVLFGFYRRSSSDLVDMQGPTMDAVINKINTQLAALYGADRVALDSFRKQIVDFDDELYQGLRKRFGDEIDDITIQNRIQEIVKGGHLDPSDDVRVTMLQAFVRDEKFIDDMNEAVETQPVLITDIETFGLNSGKDDITAISVFNWEKYDGETISDYLDFISDVKKMDNYHTFQSEEYLKANINSDAIIKMYENDPRFQSYDSMLEDYCKHYSSQVNNGVVVTERDILEQFIVDLDNKYITRGMGVPKIVVHNTNGFDLDFIISKLKDPDYLIFPTHIRDLELLNSASYNILRRLLKSQGDISLSKSQEDWIRENLSIYASRIPDDISLGAVDINETHELLDSIIYRMDNVQNNASNREVYSKVRIGNRGSKSVSELPIDGKTIDDMLLDQDLLRELYNFKGSFDEQVKALNKGTLPPNTYIRDIYSSTVFEGNVFGKLKDSLKKGYEHRSLFKEMNEKREALMLKFGYKKFFERGKVSHIFDPPLNLDFISMKRMGELARSVVYDSHIRMKKNIHVLNPVIQDFAKDIIEWAQSYGVKVTEDNMDMLDELSYYRYLIVPDNAYERYALAKKIYDKFMITEADYTRYVQLLGKDFKNLKKKDKDLLYKVAHGGEDFKTFCESVDDFIVKESKFTSQNILCDIYKDVPKPVTRAYTDAVSMDVNELRNIASCIRNESMNVEEAIHGSVGDTLTGLHNAKLRSIRGIMSQAADLFESIAHIERYFDKTDTAGIVRGGIIYASGQTYKAMKAAQDMQILSFVNKSEHNLLSHLLFHNQLLVIPARGSDGHIHEFNVLRKMLANKEEGKIVDYFDGDYLYIGIDKKWENKLQIDKDGRTIREDAEMYFGNESIAYTAPKYEKLGIDGVQFEKDFNDFMTNAGFRKEREKDIYYVSREKSSKVGFSSNEEVEVARSLVNDSLDYLENYHNHLGRLTSGNSIGSTGHLHDMSVQRKAYSNLPNGFKKRIISEDYTCNERFFHTPSMQMSFLGDADNCWHVGQVSVEETDVLLSTYDTLQRTARRATEEACYIDFMFNKNDPLCVNKLFDSVPEKEVIQSLKDNDNVVVAVMLEANTDTGYIIKELTINNKKDLLFAKKHNAIVMDYASYYDMVEIVNRVTSSNTLFKVWTRLAALNKQLALANHMTIIRNILDAYLKGILDTGSPVNYSKNLINAIQLKQQYTKMSRIIEKERGLYHCTDLDIERNYERLAIANNVTMDKDTFMELDGWFKAGRSGGQSQQAVHIEEMVNRGRGWKDATKSQKTGRDIIATDREKFRMFTSEEAGKYYDLLSDSEKELLDKETFLGIHNESLLNVTDTQMTKYDCLVDSIAYEFRNDKLTRNTLKSGYNRVHDNWSKFIMAGMSKPEEILRLGQYLSLADLGFTESAIHRHIVQSQFDESVKTRAQIYLETIIPFYSFSKSTLSFWAKMIEDDPTSLRILEHMFSQVSWNFDDIDMEDYDEIKQIATGAINLNLLFNKSSDESKMSENHWFNLNPSFVDALSTSWDPTARIGNLLYSPFKQALGYGAYTTGSDLFNIFGYDNVNGWENYDTLYHVVNGLPVVNQVYDKYKTTVDVMYDLGNAVKFRDIAFEANGFDIYCAKLEEKGLWFDRNTRTVKSLSKKNNIGLNRMGIFSREENYKRVRENMLLQEGKVWDNNLEAWVYPSERTYGGLNKEYDFNIPGQWEEFKKEYERRKGQKYDANQKKFVDPEDYIPGMLNKKDLDWSEKKAYRKKLFNEYWDANQAKWVQKENYIPGGLNSENLDWNEICALKYKIRGEEWDSEKHAWIKTREPEIKIEGVLYNNQKEIFLQKHESKINFANHTKSFIDQFGTVAYADSVERGAGSDRDILHNMSEIYALTHSMNRHALTGNPVNDSLVFQNILSEAHEYDKKGNYPYQGVNKGSKYYSGKAGDVSYKRKSFVPSKRSFVNIYGNRGVQVGGKRYSDPFSFSNDNSGLKMAVSKYAAYDSYYEYEYNKLYHVNGTKDFLAHYPQTSEVIQRYGNRFNNSYNVTSYYSGVYYAGQYKGLSNTLRNSLKQQNKLREYQH